eukprot:scaffold8026_cov34-Prasinocladus_malaysianus.AAC.4
MLQMLGGKAWTVLFCAEIDHASNVATKLDNPEEPSKRQLQLLPLESERYQLMDGRCLCTQLMARDSRHDALHT